MVIIILTLAALYMQTGCIHQAARTVTSREISPIVDPDGADPFVTVYAGKYVYTKTTGNYIAIFDAGSIPTLGAAREHVIYEPDGRMHDLWAPEIWRIDGEWYIYFAAASGEKTHRMFVLHNASENPFDGEWICSPVTGMDDKFAIDGTIMELEGKRYFIWSGWEGYDNVQQNLYLAEMISPTEVMSEKICISQPQLSWETVGEPKVNEAPEIVVREGVVNLLYSASGSWTDDYCVGVLTMSGEKDPKQSENWIKSGEPVLARSEGVYGPGHHCIVPTLDGKEDIIVYHAARFEGGGWKRNIRYGYVSFGENGVVETVVPVSGEALLPIPSGGSDVIVYPYDQLDVAGDIEKNVEERRVTGFAYTDDRLSLCLPESKEDMCVVVFACIQEISQNLAVDVQLVSDGEVWSETLHGSKDMQPLFFRIPARFSGKKIHISSVTGGTTFSVSHIEIRK